MTINFKTIQFILYESIASFNFQLIIFDYVIFEIKEVKSDNMYSKLYNRNIPNCNSIIGIFSIILIMPFSSCFCQGSIEIFKKKVVEIFREDSWPDKPISEDSLYFSIWRQQDFNVSVSENPILFDTTHLIIKNPYRKKEENEISYEKRDANYPISFSIIYDNTLIALFDKGNFLCLNLNNFSRNFLLENQLNSKKIRYHWLSDGKLNGISRNAIFEWDNNKWVKKKGEISFGLATIMYDDDKFIIFRDCIGEWGGTLYFYDKITGKTFFTESSCANTIQKSDTSYIITSNLGHGGGFTEIKEILDPKQLTLTNQLHLGEIRDEGALGYSDSSNASIINLNWYGIELYSTFKFGKRNLHIVSLNRITFIGEIINNEIKVIDVPFSNKIFTGDPVTLQYGEYTLINLDNYGAAFHRESSVLIIKEEKIIKIDWNEDHFD